MPKKIYWKESLPSYSGMKQTNLIEKTQKLIDDNEFFKRKFKEVKKENRMLRKENAELKKNLDNF